MFEATIVLVVVLIALLVTSAPIAVALGLTSLVYFYYFTLIPMTQVSERLFNALNSFPLMAIPFFILAANIMSRGGISRRLPTSVRRWSGTCAAAWRSPRCSRACSSPRSPGPHRPRSSRSVR